MLEYYYSKLLRKLRGKATINSRIHKTSKVESGSHIINSSMDRHSFCGYDCEIINCEIGSFCSIANNVIIGGAMHPIHWLSTSPVFFSGRDSVKAKFALHKREEGLLTTIGHDVWIGNNVIIKQGVNIGTGSIIGMGSIVTKNVEPYSIVAGNPAKEIRKRFDKRIIDGLLISRWWELSDDLLRKYAKNITNPELFLRELNDSSQNDKNTKQQS